MRRSNRFYLVLMVLLLALSLVVTMSGLAESETETPDEGEEAVGEETVVEPITITASVEEVLTDTLDVGIELTTPVTITAPLVVSPEVTATEEISLPLPLEPPEEPEADEPPVPTLYTVTPGIELTVYNDSLALVKEVRTLQLEEGSNVHRYSDVPALIDPTSVQVGSLSDPQGLTVLEQNYEYDLVSGRSLTQKYVDQEISLVTENGTAYSGTLLSGDDDLILQSASGVQIISRERVQEISFPALPEGLITRPTLVWLLHAAEAGEQDVQVTYLTGGVGWEADYNLLYRPESDQLDLTGWVTLVNNSGASYEEAKLKLVAGDLNLEPKPMPMAVMETRGIGGGATAVEERSFFEYHLYEIGRPVTVRNRQTKQIQFASASGVTATKTLVYEASPQGFVTKGSAIIDPGYGSMPDTPVRVELTFQNESESGMGLPLPAGTMRVYQADVDGGAELVGEDRIEHTPRGEAVTLYLGDAFDVVGEHLQTAFDQLGERSIEESYRVTLRNHKAEDIEVRVIEHLFRAQDAEVRESSMEYETVDASTIAYQVPVAADGQAVISYTVRYEW